LIKPLNEHIKKPKIGVEIPDFEIPEDVDYDEKKIITIQRSRRFIVRKREGFLIQDT
jgi:hypothetical protein